MANHTRGDDEVNFIKENRITKSPIQKQLRMVGKVALYGLVFGSVAALGYAATYPFAGRLIKQKTTQETVSITLETDQILPTTVLETTAAPTEPVEEIIDNAIKNYDYSVDTVRNLMSSLSTLADDLDASLVRVLAVKNGTDWFNNEVETSGLVSGVVIADTSSEVIILAPIGELANADSIKIGFSNQVQLDATIKEKDMLCGLCILSVSKEGMDERTKESIASVPLGNAYNIKRGDIIIGIGSPLGVAGSVTYGNISYVAGNTSIVDGMMRFLYTDADSNISKGSFFVNTNGELIGWASDIYTDENPTTMIATISDFRTFIEKMTNGENSAYIGIRGVDVSMSMRESGIPSGIYISNVANDSPAYVSGIQAGDILVKINDTEIHSFSDYKRVLENLHPEEMISITLVRDARNEYKELKMNLTVGVR